MEVPVVGTCAIGRVTIQFIDQTELFENERGSTINYYT